MGGKGKIQTSMKQITEVAMTDFNRLLDYLLKMIPISLVDNDN